MPKKRPKMLITAGPTREMLDPVRFISNVSTGEMGYTLAKTAVKKGYDVTLVSGPTALPIPRSVDFVPVMSARQMQEACKKYFSKSDVLVMVAAVCDFTPKRISKQKIHRTRTHHIELKRTPDIVASLTKLKRKSQTVIGFCLETEAWLESAKAKVRRKKLDGIVANYYTKTHVPFGPGRINTAFVAPDGHVERLRNVTKRQVAEHLICWVEDLSKKDVS